VSCFLREFDTKKERKLIIAGNWKMKKPSLRRSTRADLKTELAKK